LNLADELELRTMTDDDRSYVISSWLRSYAWEGRDAKAYEPRPVKGLPWHPPRSFFDDYSEVVLDLVKRSTVIVAGLRGIADSIVGWFALEGDTLHYLLVKPKFRRMGIARWLVGDAATQPLSYTHSVRDLESRRDDKTGGTLAPLVAIPSAWTYRRFRIWPQPIEEAA
jgi:GNAT superfamily N-acetyltransferase